MTPAPRPVHQIAVGALSRAIVEYVDAQRLDLTLMSTTDRKLDEDTIRQPERTNRHESYLRVAVAESWIVDVDACVGERWRPTD